VHPGLFADEAFVSCSISARLLLIGIWTEADDKGIFEWKPLTLKMRIFPAENFDMPAMVGMLDELIAGNIIRRFDACGKTYGAVRNFRKFQKPKKPNDIHPMPDDIRKFVGLGTTSSVPVENQFRTGGENPFQMEDGGWKREDGRGNNNTHIHKENLQEVVYTREGLHDADGVISDLKQRRDNASSEFEGAQ